MGSIDLKIWPYLTWPWPLTSTKFRLDYVIGPTDCQHRYLRAKWPRKHVSHRMFVTFLWWPFVTWPWARPLAKIPFVLMQYPFWTSIQHFGRVWPLFAARLTDPRAQKVKTLHCDIWPDLDLTRDLNLKILTWIRCTLIMMRAFKLRLARLTATLSFTTMKNNSYRLLFLTAKGAPAWPGW